MSYPGISKTHDPDKGMGGNVNRLRKVRYTLVEVDEEIMKMEFKLSELRTWRKGIMKDIAKMEEAEGR